jgi:Zn-dependent protease with chaperone function
MHLLIVFLSLGLAYSIRLIMPQSTKNWRDRWSKTLFLFLFPPLLLLMTAIAILWMGYRGQMLGVQAGIFSYFLALSFIIAASFFLVKLAYQAWQSQQKLKDYPLELVEEKFVKILEIDFPYSAQIGFWQPKLVISQGLLNTLDREHLQAVLAHEQAHYDYRDTFWFFWLGWLRSFTAWLPNTEAFWQELLLLRELRADLQASQKVDALLLAESLLIVSQKVSQGFPLNVSETFCAALNNTNSHNRLEERIDALLDENHHVFSTHWWSWSWLILVLFPLITVPLHY